MLPVRLDLDVTVQPDVTVVTVAGELDMTTCPYVTRVTDALAVEGQTLALDLSAVIHMDASGLSMLLRIRARAEHGVSLEASRVCSRRHCHTPCSTVLGRSGGLARRPVPRAAGRGRAR
ncbi:STAS domain-containing protein [Streptomyces vinaceus]|uniref:STAS domain-containing protein n=1 Tax=Streptomyces vinaceus TaxID=1960 RepID=UPI0036899212